MSTVHDTGHRAHYTVHRVHMVGNDPKPFSPPPAPPWIVYKVGSIST